MKYQVETNENTATAVITGQMTFDDRASAEPLADALMKTNPGNIVVNLAAVDYIDSAGLGILLTLRERANATGCTVDLNGAVGSVKEILDLACFDTLFTISD